jgi:hypothetical protein
MNWLLCRCKEPSTWKGLFVLAGLLGYSFDPELQNQLIISVTALIAAIEIFRAEKKPELPPIELQAKPESAVPHPDSVSADCDSADFTDQLPVMPTRCHTDPKPNTSDLSGWGG